MRKMLIGATLLTLGSAGTAQTQNSTTNCNVFGSTLNCNTTTQSNPGIDWNAYNQQQQRINQQNQENINRSMQNLGSAIAADRERRRQRRESDAALAAEQAQQAAEAAEQAAQHEREDVVTKAMQAAIASDTAPLPLVPREAPVLLACTVGKYSTSLALYEKNGRVDVTEAGATKARAATFTPDLVSWRGSVWRTAVSRVDMSLISVAILPELAGAQVNGTCSIAERKF